MWKSTSEFGESDHLSPGGPSGVRLGSTTSGPRFAQNDLFQQKHLTKWSESPKNAHILHSTFLSETVILDAVDLAPKRLPPLPAGVAFSGFSSLPHLHFAGLAAIFFFFRVFAWAWLFFDCACTPTVARTLQETRPPDAGRLGSHVSPTQPAGCALPPSLLARFFYALGEEGVNQLAGQLCLLGFV
ncbi:hypothetical protein BD289DRAFT_44635 [Coniella lustricola]|uniref:Uncharacterized protein n=1 Tax=Coniella lustricola TaxID=2025994 RepID=A0A2T3A1R1_9PEZI|nr:hypothetical protein BD289DRAFT_44635 [Coniella lustricola]